MTTSYMNTKSNFMNTTNKTQRLSTREQQQISLLELKEYVENKQLPLCKTHPFQKYQYFCATPYCQDFLKVICQDCIDPDDYKTAHDGHIIMNIKDFYHRLINELSKLKNQNFYKNFCRDELTDLKNDCKVMLNLISSIVEQIDITCKIFETNIKKTKTPQEIIIHNIQESLLGQNWKENTETGLNQRLQNIYKVIQVKRDGIDINRDTHQIYELCQNVEYFSEFTKQRLSEANQILESCLAFTSQKFGQNTNKKSYTGKEYDDFVKIMFDNDAANLCKPTTKKVILTKISNYIIDSFSIVKNVEIVYFDLSGEWNNDPSLTNYIFQFLKQFSHSLKYVWFNLNGWKNMTNKGVREICQGIQKLQKLQTLVLNILQWGKNSKFLTYQVFDELRMAIHDKKDLESLSIWTGYIQNINDTHIQQFANVITNLKNLKVIDLQFPFIGSENEQITNESLISIFNIPLSCLKLEEFNLGLDRWGYKNQKITVGAFKDLLKSLNQAPQLQQFSLSMKEAYNMDTSDKKEIQRMIKGVVKNSDVQFFTDY